jgi:hypothetical protein
MQRRWLVLAVVVLVLAAGAAGAVVALTRGSGERLASASYPGFGLSFRYPAAWKRVDWCWTGTVVSPIAVLTSGRKVPVCHQGNGFSSGTSFPPPQLLGPDELTVSWLYSAEPHGRVPPVNATLGGRGASVRLGWTSVPHKRVITVGAICGKVGTRERTLVAVIPHVLTQSGVVRASALICGPNFAAGEQDVRRVLASARFGG